MKKTVCIIFIFSFLVPVKAQEKAFAVWQGFEHKWMYNHRLNRLGDYIAQPPYQKKPHPFTATHTGATGLGKDTAIFRSYFAEVKTRDIDFFPGVEKLKMQGKQGDLYQITKKLFIIDAELAKKTKLAVVFNGFDLVSESGADKLQLLKINFSDPVRRNRSDTIELTLDVAIVVDCRSFECNRFNKQFQYDLSVRYVLLGALQDQMHITATDYNESVIWTKLKTSAEMAIPKTIQGNYGYKNGFLAFKNIFIVLNHDHWILSYANAISRSDYQASSGTLKFKHLAYIRQWEAGMKQVSSQSLFSEKRAGWGMLQGSLQLVQFRSGNISYFERLGYIGWGGNNMKADHESSINSENREIK
jgi:hypothetical protein